MQEHFPVSPRGFTWCSFLLSRVNLLFVSSFSVHADDRICIEKRESSMFEYPAAMRIIKDFYRDTPHPAVGNQEKGKWLYFCLLSVFFDVCPPVMMNHHLVFRIEISAQSDARSVCLIEKSFPVGRRVADQCLLSFRLDMCRTKGGGFPWQDGD